MFFLFSFLWFIRTTKAILFYLYLWQLKEYHVGRFLDHFRTEKGRKLLLNPLNVIKIILLLSFPAYPLLLLFSVFVLYILEFLKTIFDFLRKQLKRPVFTLKAAFLISAALVFESAFLFVLLQNIKDIENIVWFIFWLLIFDILTPMISSLIVLIFQPLAVLQRNRIIKKAKIKRGQFKNLLVVGITGSYGKTSTKEFLAAILSEKFKILKTKEHQNSEVGVSLCILNDLRPEYEIFICEMGAYSRGGIKLLCGIAKPKIGIITGINEQHMATFGSQKNIIKTKYELIESLPEDGMAFFNAKNKYCLELYNKTLRLRSGQAQFKKFLYGENAEFPGGENIFGAMAVAKELGMGEEEISRAASKIENKIGGIRVKKGINGINVIDATYSANPDGVIANLEYMKNNFSGRKIIVMPCLIELGKASKEVHRRIGNKIGEVCDLAIITTKDSFKEIKEGAGGKAVFMENPKEILEKIKSFCREGKEDKSSSSPFAVAREGDAVLLESRVPGYLIKELIGR